MSRVDVLADDRGLQGCFKVANIQQEWAQDFITKHKLVTLDDYIYSVAHDTWEKGVETLVSQVPTLRDNMIALAQGFAALLTLAERPCARLQRQQRRVSIWTSLCQRRP